MHTWWFQVAQTISNLGKTNISNFFKVNPLLLGQDYWAYILKKDLPSVFSSNLPGLQKPGRNRFWDKSYCAI